MRIKSWRIFFTPSVSTSLSRYSLTRLRQDPDDHLGIKERHLRCNSRDIPLWSISESCSRRGNKYMYGAIFVVRMFLRSTWQKVRSDALYLERTREQCECKSSRWQNYLHDYSRAFFRIRFFFKRRENRETILNLRKVREQMLITWNVGRILRPIYEVMQGHHVVGLYICMSLTGRFTVSLYDPIRPEEMTIDIGEKSAVEQRRKKRKRLWSYIFILNQSMRRIFYEWLRLSARNKFFCL